MPFFGVISELFICYEVKQLGEHPLSVAIPSFLPWVVCDMDTPRAIQWENAITELTGPALKFLE